MRNWLRFLLIYNLSVIACCAFLLGLHPVGILLLSTTLCLILHYVRLAIEQRAVERRQGASS